MPVYDAFISYSQARDVPIATALQAVVQTLGKPWYKLRELRGFRDATSIPAVELWPAIEQALSQTRYAILLASPESARSPWVRKEMEFWLATKGAHALMIGLTAGELKWGENDFVWSPETPLPPVLKGAFQREPRWVDLRPFRQSASRRDAQFIELGANFVATISGKLKQDLLSEELRQQRRALRHARSAAAVMLVLAIGVAWQWQVAATQRDRAERTLATSTKSANALVTDLGQRFRETAGIQQQFVIGILDQARKLVEELAQGETTNRELMESRGFILAELSSTLNAQGDWDNALKYGDTAVAMFRALLKGESSREDWLEGLASALDRRGDALVRFGRREEAHTAYRESLDITARLTGSGKPGFKRNLAVAYEKLGGVALAQGKVEDALDWYRKCAALREELAAADRSDIEAQRDLAVAHERIGVALEARGSLDEALALYRRSHESAERLANAHRERTDLKRDLAVSYQRLADLQQKRGDATEALDFFRKDFGIMSALAASDDRIDWKDALLTSTQRLADALRAEQPAEAISLYRQAIPIAEIVGGDPKYAQRRHTVAIIHHKLGETLRVSGRPAEAVASYRASLEVRLALARQDLTPENWEAELRENFQRLSDLLGDLKRPQEALTVAQQRVEIVRQLRLGGELGLARALGTLAWYALCANAPAEALVAAQEAIALAPQELWPKANQAHALMFTGSADEARRIYLAHRGEAFSATKSWEQSVLEDFRIFESAGLAAPLMAEIEAAFSAPRAN